MSLLVVGLSHHRAPFSLLEEVSLTADMRRELTRRLVAGEHVGEVVVLSTCNRTEVYAATETFHGGLAEVTRALAEVSGVDADRLAAHAHVHHGERAIAHTFSVAAGLDSMAVGETQVLGQLRTALAASQSTHAVGPELNALLQRALRVGKRVHTETGLDKVSVSLVEAGLRRASDVLGDLTQARVLVVGAGAMAGLAAAHVARLAPAALTIVNRTEEAAARLAHRVDGLARPASELAEAVAEADLVLTCTGASGVVVPASHVTGRPDGEPLVLVDLAVPHDVDPAAAEVPGVHVLGLEALRDELLAAAALPQVRAASDVVVGEVAAFLAERGADTVAPTVTALRDRAHRVVAAELARFDHRVGLDERERHEVERLVNRVVDKLLHSPTVRVKELSNGHDGQFYADALRELFELDPHETAAVSSPPRDLGGLP